MEPNAKTIKDFFEKILQQDTSDYYITISTKNITTSKFINKSFSANQINDIVKYCVDKNELCHVYFGIGLTDVPTEDNKRAKNNSVICLPGFWMDIDYGEKGHSSNNLPPTIEDALSLLKDVQEPSITIATGGGIHAYWLFKQPLAIIDDNREKISRTLQSFQNNIIKKWNNFGWKVDNTANIAQTLRVPGTINHKYDKLSTVLNDQNITYELQDLCAYDKAEENTVNNEDNINHNTEETVTNYDIGTDDYSSISEYNLLKTGCEFIEYCERNSRNLSEPEWHAMISIVSRIENGKQHCHEISQNYGNYSYAETENKIQQTTEKGRPCTCKYIETKFGNKACKNCLLKTIVNNPIQLSKINVLNLNRDRFIQINNKHAAISVGGKSLILNFNETDPARGFKKFDFSTYEDFNKRYLPMHGKTINKKGEFTNDKFTKIWLNSNYRKDFPNGLVFSQTEIEGAYNIWQGFANTPMLSGDWSLYQDHIKKVVCKNKPELYNYVFAWMANIVQNFNKRPGVALVLRGERGTGKSVFADIFGKIFGGHYITVTNKKHLVGNFNNHLCDKVLVFADEAIYSGDKEGNEILKTLITGNTLTIEKKGIDAIVVPNNISLIIAGNNNELVNAGTSERRYLVLELSDIHKQDHEYFENMFKQMNNGGYAKMLHDLQSYDIRDTNLRCVPKTPELFDQLLGAWHDKPVQKFVFECLTENIDFEEEQKINTNVLYDKFLEWVKINKQKVVDKSNFQKTFNKFYGSKITTKGGNKVKFAVLPSVEESRKHFENVIGMDIL